MAIHSVFCRAQPPAVRIGQRINCDSLQESSSQLVATVRPEVTGVMQQLWRGI